MAKITAFSKRHEGKAYLYWWDVWDRRRDAIGRSGVLVLVQKDTKLRASLPAEELLPLLTERRRTTRGQNKGGKGNWGLYVRPGRLDEIEVEGARGGSVTITVEWDMPHGGNVPRLT